MKTLDEKMAALCTRRRQKVETRAAELNAEEMSLRDLRDASAAWRSANFASGTVLEGLGKSGQRAKGTPRCRGRDAGPPHGGFG